MKAKLRVIAVACVLSGSVVQVAEPKVLDIGNRRELFVDDYLIERMSGGAELRMHNPTPREIAIEFDQPWEGALCDYVTVFQDGDRYRMYYRGSHVIYVQGGYTEPHPSVTCYAESKDGVHWTKPELGLFEFKGSKKNNIILTPDVVGKATHNFCPFLDTRPGVPASERYKALGGVSTGTGLHAFVSADGIRWKQISGDSVMPRGPFDSQNLAFWDSVRGEYRAYFRDFRNGRDISTATSKDFRTWEEVVWIEYSPGRGSELYTNQIIAYHRAPHILLGFPTRYLDRGWSESMRALPQLEFRKIRASKVRREGTALTDGMFMSSRDGRHFRIWPESFVRPGLRTRNNWFYGDNYQNWGLIETRSHIEDAPNELSMFLSEGYGQGNTTTYRRYTIRIDGFVSVQARMSGGELLTKPLVFKGTELELNFSTSIAGSIRVEMQTDYGTPIEGFALANCPEIFGDTLERVVSWKGGSDVSKLAGKPVRLRLVMKDADLYSIRFR